jgi:hypothetical protein
MNEQPIIPQGMSLKAALDYPMEKIEQMIETGAAEATAARANFDYNRLRMLEGHLNQWKMFYNWRQRLQAENSSAIADKPA